MDKSKKKKKRQLNAILLLDKPSGITSNHALQRIKWLFKALKAGHAGTLDPLATGMLPIFFGEATKFSQFLLNADKQYQATACLGIKTNTGDIDGKVVENRPWAHITKSKIIDQILKLKNSTSQIPPMYSAIKHQGKPLYKLARAGINVSLKNRKITIYSMDLVNYHAPYVNLNISCSKGTYIRTLIEDLGNFLGCCAHITQLRRLNSGPYKKERMHKLESIEQIAENETSECAIKNKNTKAENPVVFNTLDKLLLPLDTAVSSLNAVQLDSDNIKLLQQGKKIILDAPNKPEEIVRVYEIIKDDDLAFVGLAELNRGMLHAKRLLMHDIQVQKTIQSLSFD